MAGERVSLLAIDQNLHLRYAGQIHRLIKAPPPERTPAEFPRKLSETGLFTSVPEHKLHPAVVSYSVKFSFGW